LKDGKVVIARLWGRFEGRVPTRSEVIVNLNNERFETICVYLMRNSDEPDYYDQAGLKTFYLTRKRRLKMFSLPTVIKLARILKEEKVDVLHCHRHQASVYGATAAKLAGGRTAVITHVHGLNRAKRFRRKLVYKIISPLISKYLTVGEAVRRDVIENFPGSRSEDVISTGNSIDTKRFDIGVDRPTARREVGIESDKYLFGTVGRFAPTKGYEYLIEAFAKVRESIVGASLVFVGDGDEMERIKEMADELGVGDDVIYLGRRSDKEVPVILRCFDCFVLPSVAEGIPCSVLEAMASRVPVVATNVGGVGEILDGGKYGRIVPARDSAGLAEGMLEIAGSSEKALAELRQSAYERVINNFNHEVVIRKLEGIYRELGQKAAEQDRGA
jgi:glycosyltransferase involved in cell wall biosynthesis